MRHRPALSCYRQLRYAITLGGYAAEARTWAAMHTHMFTIADALADGLAKQFPAKF